MGAATMAAAAAMHAVLPKLTAALLLQQPGGGGEEFVVNGGPRQDLTFLRDELRLLQASLQAGTQGDDRCPHLEEWSRKLRDLFISVEDSVDALVRRAERKKAAAAHHRHGLRFRLVDKLMDSTAASRRFRGLRSRLEQVSEGWRNMYQLTVACSRHRRKVQEAGAIPSRSNSEPLPHPELRADAARLAATLDGRRDEVARLLLLAGDDERGRVVVSIHGSPGLGKTTLAREAYHAARRRFDCVAWVSTPPGRDTRDVLWSILGQVDGDYRGGGGGDDGTSRDLVGGIRECLRHKRYLVVLDGMGNRQAWGIIGGALPLNHLGSRVLITTCSIDVTNSCSSGNGSVYYIKPLGLGDSWTLFRQRILGSQERSDTNFVEEDIAIKIAKKCSGIPLAISTMSSLLAHKPGALQWMHLLNSMTSRSLWYMNNQGMRNLLSLAYNNLPHHLRLFLWHLSMFPADYPIDHDRAIRSWIAEGLLVREEHGKTVMQVGQSYLDELMDRHMIQPDHGSNYGKTKAYIISAMMLEILRSESVKENFVTILENGKPTSALPSKVRRLSIINTNSGHDIPASLFKRNGIVLSSVSTSHIRSLYIFGSVGKKLTFKHLTFVRILDLQGCKDLKNHHVEEISGLQDLRYLSIRDTPISEIPDRIGQLQYLTTLDLRCTQVQELPKSVLQLQSLKHLLHDIL